MKFRIPVDLLIDMLTTGKETKLQCISGLPKGTKYISQYVDHTTMIVHLVVEHPSFEQLELGELIPELTIRLAQIPETSVVEIPTNLIQ